MFEIPLAAAIIATAAKINQAESGYARNLVDAVSFNRPSSSNSSKTEAQRDANRKLCAC